MKTSVISLYLIFIFMTMSSVSIAQDVILRGRSAIELHLGFWGGAKASNTIGLAGIQSEAATNGFMGGLGYSYWLKENLSLTLAVSLQSAKASTTISIFNVTQQVSTVVPLLLGVRFYIPEPEPGENIRPFVSAAVGTYIGSESANSPLSQQAHVENAFGGRLGAGIDFFLGNHFKLGVGVGYHLMTDFENTVGARKNYNGAEFSLVTSYIF